MTVQEMEESLMKEREKLEKKRDKDVQIYDDDCKRSSTINIVTTVLATAAGVTNLTKLGVDSRLSTAMKNGGNLERLQKISNGVNVVNTVTSASATIAGVVKGTHDVRMELDKIRAMKDIDEINQFDKEHGLA